MSFKYIERKGVFIMKNNKLKRLMAITFSTCIVASMGAIGVSAAEEVTTTTEAPVTTEATTTTEAPVTTEATTTTEAPVTTVATTTEAPTTTTAKAVTTTAKATTTTAKATTTAKITTYYKKKITK